MTCARSSCRVDVHMASSTGVPNMLESLLCFILRFVSPQCSMHIEAGQSTRRILLYSLTDAGQCYREYRLCIGCALHRNLSLVCTYYGLGNGETQSRTRGGDFHLVIGGYVLAPVEAIKDVRKIVWMDTLAVINDLHQRMAVLSVKLELDPSFGGGPTVFDGVIE